MKFIIVLILILSNQIAMAVYDVTSSCSQVVTDLSQNEVNDSNNMNKSKRLVRQKNKDRLVKNVERTALTAMVPIAVPLSVASLPFVVAYFVIKSVYDGATKTFPRYLRQQRTQRLEKRLTQNYKEMAQLENDWGLLLHSVVQLTMKKYHKPKEIHEKLLSLYQEMGFSKEEIGRIAQSVRDFIMLDVDLQRLSEQGFTREQTIQIVQLGIIAEYRDSLFRREKRSIKSKEEILRQAGFTEEEINRIPVEILKKDKTRILLSYLDFVLPSSALVLSSDTVYWVITDNSFIWEPLLSH